MAIPVLSRREINYDVAASHSRDVIRGSFPPTTRVIFPSRTKRKSRASERCAISISKRSARRSAAEVAGVRVRCSLFSFLCAHKSRGVPRGLRTASLPCPSIHPVPLRLTTNFSSRPSFSQPRPRRARTLFARLFRLLFPPPRAYDRLDPPFRFCSSVCNFVNVHRTP